MAHHKLGDDFFVFLRVFKHVRSWANHAHVADKHIKELGHLIQTRSSQECANLRNAGIILRCLNFITIMVHGHASELVTPERGIVTPGTQLFKQHRPFAFPFDQNRDQGI